MNRLSGVQTEPKDRIVGLYSQAHGLAIGGNYAEALQLYDRIIANAPELVFKAPQINYERALCLKALGRIEQTEDKGHLPAIRSESTGKDNTISKREGPIVVYQMGKVGSVSVYESLKASGVGVPIYHVHYLTRDGIERITPGHQAAHLLRNQIDKGFGGAKWRIVSSVREPVARNISAFFQNIDKWYPNFNAHCEIGSVDVEGLIKLFVEKYPHDTPLTWFDSEMKSVFGINVFAYDFPKSEGYKIYRTEHADLLLMRLEDMNERIGEAFKEFLDIDGFTLSDANVSSGKEYRSVYREFVDSVILPEAYVGRMYSSKYARHFYSNQELNRFKRKWTALKHEDVKLCQENRATASSSWMRQGVMGAGGSSRAERAIRSCLSVRPDDPEFPSLLSNIQSIKGSHDETRARAEIQAVEVGTEKVEEMRRKWNYLSGKSRLGFIAHLQEGEVWDDLEFHLTGIRFVERMMERFQEYGRVEPSCASILEVGCGVGRLAKPLACRFRHVFGVDISAKMVEVAREYCLSLPNVVFSVNDGFSLKEFDDGSFEYCVTGGVFQHITDVNVIMNYIGEAIRILKPGGIFLFQFEGNKENPVGHGTCGARITAKVLDAALKDRPYRIREVSIDPADPMRNVVIVLQKTFHGEITTETERSFQLFRMSERRWVSGVYDDIKTKTHTHRRLKEPQKRLTFYDCE